MAEEGGAVPRSTVNESGAFEPFSIESVPWEEHSRGSRFGTRYQQLGEFGGGSHIGVCRETLAPGRQAYPAHYHMLEEEHLLILEGTLTLRLGDRSYPMAAGDYACFPAGQKVGHALINEGTAPCRYLIIGERSASEVVFYTESGRVGVRLAGQGFRGTETMEYWDGIDTRASP